MKKTIAIMLMFATGCMSLAGCAETEVIETAEGTELFETEAVAAEETPDGGYIRYTYRADETTGERTLYKVEEYNADGTTTGNITIRNADGDMVTKISGYGSDEHVYRTEYIRNDNGDVIRIELYEDDVLLEYKEYEYYSAGRRSSITSYQADGTVVYTNVCEYEHLDG
jgi:hypothetical protein